MPNEALSQALREAYASAPVDAVIYDTLELRHPSFVDDQGNASAIRVVCGFENLTATLEADAPLDQGEAVTFIACAFDFVLPEIRESQMPELTITIDNVSREIVRNIELAQTVLTPVSCTYRPFLSTDLSSPQMDPPLHMTLRNVTCDVYRVQAKASFFDLLNRSFPNEVYTRARFPGLVRS